ncbi:MAG: chemotaxis protein CheB [Luteimonas sp.]
MVLLARPGEACGRLEDALREAGAEIASVIDPTDGGPEAALAAKPQGVLVALDPLVEEALERYEPLLSDPAITVIFDEAELAAQREGWDTARWVRHLAAKLNRHDDVLPPGRESETDWPLPGPLPLPPEVDGLDITAFAAEASKLAASVPRDDAYLDRQHSSAEGLTLVEANDPMKPRVSDAPTSDAARSDSTGAIDGATFGELSLVDDAGGTASPAGEGQGRGAVLVEGGIGAPDAVRQLLAALPATFPQPVLVRLQLDGGHYDRLVKQMARASTLPVVLAEPGRPADAGTVHFLDANTGIVAGEAGLVFVASEQPLPPLHLALPPKDSAILLMSGSAVSMVDAVLEQAWAGALVAGQAADECYEPAATNVLIERGGESATLAGLADRLAQRWPSPASSRHGP